jgi:hypothetical protein
MMWRSRGGTWLTQRASGRCWDGSVGVAVRRTRACGGAAAGEEARTRRSKLHGVSAARAAGEVVLEALCKAACVCSGKSEHGVTHEDKAESTVRSSLDNKYIST